MRVSLRSLFSQNGQEGEPGVGARQGHQRHADVEGRRFPYYGIQGLHIETLRR